MALARGQGRAWRRLAKQIVVRDCGRCHLCGHYGANSADHLISETEGGPTESRNLKAVHGHPKPCAACSSAAGKAIYCNQIRGGYSIERAVRILRKLTGLDLPAGNG